MLLRAALIFAIVGFISGRMPDAAQTAHLGTVRAEIAATRPYARLRVQMGKALVMFRTETGPARNAAEAI